MNNSILSSVFLTTESHETRMCVADQCVCVSLTVSRCGYFQSLNPYKSAPSPGFSIFTYLERKVRLNSTTYQTFFLQLERFLPKMSDENTITSDDVYGTSDSFSSREDPSNLNNRELALSLDNINSNMGKMASLLAKLCEKPAPKERPPGLKRQSTSAVSDNSDSESDEDFHKSGKPRRQSSPSDDNISLHASDDLDDADDIKMLTECSKATGQKGRETPAKETQLLQDCANSLDEDDATGDKIQQEFIALKRWGKKLSSDKIKSFSDKYKQPQNCSDIKGIKVNPEIWSQLNAKKEKVDLKISNLQQSSAKSLLLRYKRPMCLFKIPLV